MTMEPRLGAGALARHGRPSPAGIVAFSMYVFVAAQAIDCADSHRWGRLTGAGARLLCPACIAPSPHPGHGQDPFRGHRATFSSGSGGPLHRCSRADPVTRPSLRTPPPMIVRL